MAKLIAFEWDTREARIAVASPRGNDLVVEQAFAIELAGGASEEAPSISEIGAQLAAVLAEQGLTGSDALVAVPRTNIELRTLSLPHAPPEEIPDMVRFQAMQAFTSIGDDWPLDYVELEAHDDTISVLAAVASPKLLKQAAEVCAASELKTRCLVLRPFAAVSLLHRFESIDVFRSSLIVDLLPDGVDLTAISNGHVVFMRSVRLPANTDGKAQATALVGELRRTIGAAQNQMGGSRIEQIIVCGSETRHAELQQSIAAALPLDVVTFDPFQAVRLTAQLKQELPDHSGRFAPLLGMLACQATGTGHTIDFLNPRKRPKPPSNKRRNMVIAAAVLTVAAIGAFVFLAKKTALEDEIAKLKKDSANLNVPVEKAKQLIAKADRITEFEQSDVTWLDEIREVATHMPDADDVILNEVYVGTGLNKGGLMILRGNVASTDVIAELEESLRYGDNRVKGDRANYDQSRPDYPYQFETQVFVPPDVLDSGHSLGRPELDGGKKAKESAAEESLVERVTSEGVAEPAAAEVKTPTLGEAVAPDGEAVEPAASEATPTDTEETAAPDTTQEPAPPTDTEQQATNATTKEAAIPAEKAGAEPDKPVEDPPAETETEGDSAPPAQAPAQPPATEESGRQTS